MRQKAASSLTLQQCLIPTYFSYRKRQLLAFQDDDGGFIELTPQGLQLNKSILLRKRDVELQFPAGTDVLWLAALLRAL
ncbi:IS66 family insertion sequence element accessory protein TnpB [Acinetobacter baumannii]|uniref:IS66 family insertion sequence element accessory protein TnpB n=1 Tax=Acinetobacter baumannii TaxID=470 RepID=UPI00396F314E